MRLGDCKLAVIAGVLWPAQFLVICKTRFKVQLSLQFAAAASRSTTQATAVSADYRRMQVVCMWGLAEDMQRFRRAPNASKAQEEEEEEFYKLPSCTVCRAKGESFARRKWRNISPTLSRCPKAGGTGETTSAKGVLAKVFPPRQSGRK